jgi:hypothetical protein
MLISETTPRMLMKFGMRWSIVKVKQRLVVTRIMQGKMQIFLGHTGFCLKHFWILLIINEKRGNNL